MTPSFEDALADAIVAHDLEGAAGLERVIAAHPSHADSLRTHFSRLRGYGLVHQTEVGASAPSLPDGGEFPERLGEFRLLQRLGGGGMGVVYLAQQESLQRRVALKLVRREHLYFPGAHDRFEREVAALAKLQHPGIVPVYGAGEAAGIPWLAMEHVDGASLDQVIQHVAGRDPAKLGATDLRQAVLAIVSQRAAAADAPKPLPTTTASGAGQAWQGTWSQCCVRIVRDVALALQHAHERGVLHRDVKPSNVMLTLDGRALLLDFGLALADGSVRLTKSGSQLGSPAYMSPEQMRGDAKRLDARTDVYSLGVTLYELLTLRMPFAAESVASTRELVLAGRTPPLRVFNRAIARDIELVCKKAIDVEAPRRYATAAAFAQDLDNVLTQHPIRARAPSAWTVARRWAQRHPAATIAAIAGVLLFVVAPIVFLVQQQGALAAVRLQRDRARQAVDTMLERVASETLVDVPRLLSMRHDLLVGANAFYEQFHAEAPEDRDIQARAAEVAAQLAKVELKLGASERALATITRAETLARVLPAAVVLQRHTFMLKSATLLSMSRLDEGLAALQEARQRCRGDDREAVLDGISIERTGALLLLQAGRIDEALAALRQLDERWQHAREVLTDPPCIAQCIEDMLAATGDELALHLSRADAAAVAATLRRGDELTALAATVPATTTTMLTLARLDVLRAHCAAASDDRAQQERCLRQALATTRTALAEQPDHANALRMLASVLNDLALFLERTEASGDEALQLYEESVATSRRLIAQDPAVPETRANLVATLVNYGAARIDRDDARQARTAFEEAMELALRVVQESPNRPDWRANAQIAAQFLAQACGALGDHVAEVATAERLAAAMADDPHNLRLAAGLVAAALTTVANDPKLSAEARRARLQDLAQQAIARLRDAAGRGCTDLEELKKPPFTALQEAPGYEEVLTRVAANAKAAPSTAK